MKQTFVLCILLLLFGFQSHTYAKEQRTIVQTHEVYTFEDLTEDLYHLQKAYRDSIQVKVIGHSTYKKPIYAVKVGQGNQSILINASHHGREWMTSLLTMKMIEEYAHSHKYHKEYEGYHTSLLDEVSIWFVPMVNPDGVEIQQTGLFQIASSERLVQLLMMNGGSVDFSRWKANGAGIDLNRQYEAGWDQLEDSAPFPFYQLYKGIKPHSAPEVQALVTFTEKIQPLMAVSYHSSGRVLYWYYQTEKAHIKRDKKIAKQVADITGYKLDKPIHTAIGGGYTDWFIQTYKKPAMTIEISYEVNETNPPLSVFQEEWNRNKTVGIHLAREAIQLK
ncbi:carboxypeptidase [Bacillus sp. BGMRC 2118]|nr:carboxypeptidase [Bacillus sp. BGMRC 2118]